MAASVDARTLDQPTIGSRIARQLSGIIFYALLALVLLAAIPYGTVEPWWEALFECVVFALTVLWLVEGMLNQRWFVYEHKIFLPLALLVLYALLQTILLPAVGIISADPFETRLFALKLLALILVGVLLVRYMNSAGRLRALLYLILGVCVLSAFFGILRQSLQHSQGFFLPFLSPHSGYGQFINRNDFAYLMEMAFGLTLGLIVSGGAKREQALIYLAFVLPVWAALVLCNSRGGLFSMLAQVIFLALLFSFAPGRLGRKGEEEDFLRRVMRTPLFRPVLIVILLLTVFIGAIWIGGEALTTRLETVSSDVADESAESNQGVRRAEIWRATWQMFADHPLTGTGFGAYLAAIPQYHHASGELTPQQAHNDYLEILASGGIIGASLVAWFLFLLLKRASRNFRPANSFSRAAGKGACAGLFGVAVHSTVDFGLHVTINALVFSGLLVIVLAGAEAKNDDARATRSRVPRSFPRDVEGK